MKNRLLHTVFICSLLVYPLSCKKYIQQQEQNALVSLISSGSWRVTRYQDHQTDITDSFAGYVFQFKSNGTVDAVFSGQTAAGSWIGDVNARTIQSDFPGAANPLKKLNYTWKVTDSYTDSVSAKTLADSVYNFLELHKN